MELLLINRNPAGDYRDGDRWFLDGLGTVHLLTAPEHAAGFGDLPGLGEVAHLDGWDDDRTVAAALALAERHPFDAVVTISEVFVLAAARVRAALGLPGASPGEVLPFRDKLLMKRLVAAGGFRVPEHAAFTSWEPAAALLARHGRVVVKPRDGAGAVGVHVVSAEPDLRALFDELGADGGYEVEEHVPGPMYQLDALRVAGTTVLDSAAGYTGVVADHASLPRAGSLTLPPGPLLDRLLAFNRGVLDAMGHVTGVTHMEVFLTPDGEIVFCEVAARPGGLGTAALVGRTRGLDLIEADLRLQLGLPLFEPRPTAALGGIAVIAGTGRRVAHLPDPAVAEQDWVVRARVRPRVLGEVAARPDDVAQQACQYVFVADDPEQQRERLHWLWEHGGLGYAD